MAEDDKNKKALNEDEVEELENEEIVEEVEDSELEEKEVDIEGEGEDEEITLEATNESFDDEAYIKALEAMSEEDEDFDFLNPYKEKELQKKQKKFEEDNGLNESDLDSVEDDNNIDD